MNNSNNNEKSRHEKFNSWITTVAAICTILGVSVISILSYLYSKPDPTPKSLEVNTNNENDQSQSSTAEPTDAPETEQITTPDPNPVPVLTAVPEPQSVVQPTMRPLSTPEVTNEIDRDSFGENSGFKEMPYQPKTGQEDEGQNTSDNDNNIDNAPKSITQDNNNLSETNESTTNKICQFDFESPGRFVLTSNKGNLTNNDGTIDVECTSVDSENRQELFTYKYSDLVNNEDASEDLTSFISVTQGIYIVKFVNCDFDKAHHQNVWNKKPA